VAALNGRIKDHEEFEPISNLLRDSHYLAPSFSPISPDLWRDIAGMVRNLCLNWILLVPPMILAGLTTKAMAYAFIDSLGINQQSVYAERQSLSRAVLFRGAALGAGIYFASWFVAPLWKVILRQASQPLLEKRLGSRGLISSLGALLAPSSGR